MLHLSNKKAATLLRELATEIDSNQCAHQHFTCWNNSDGSWTIQADTDLGEDFINKEATASNQP